jgi:hypothetical protein
VFLNTENISAFVGFSWKIEIEMHGATMKKMLVQSLIFCSILYFVLLKMYGDL